MMRLAMLNRRRVGLCADDFAGAPLRIHMCAEAGPAVASSPDVSRARRDRGRLQGDELVDRGLATWKPKLKAAFATADPGWLDWPKELSSLMATCGEAVDEAKCGRSSRRRPATSRVATGTMNEQEFYKLMMGEIEV